MCVSPVGDTVAEWSFSYIKQIRNWFRNSILTDTLGDLAVTAMHRFLFYTQVYIRPRRMMTSSLFTDSGLIRHLYIFIHWDYDTDIWLFTTTSVIRGWFFIFTVLKELWNYMQFKPMISCTIWLFNHSFELF